MIRPSFKQIRLALFFPPAPGGTGAAGPCRLAFANVNARLRLFPGIPNRVLRLAGHLALAQLRSVVSSGRTVLSPALSDAAFMVQAGPCRVVVSVRAALLPICVGHVTALVSDGHQTRERSADVQNLFADFANGHG